MIFLVHKEIPRTQADRQNAFVFVSRFILDVPPGFRTAITGKKHTNKAKQTIQKTIDDKHRELH